MAETAKATRLAQVLAAATAPIHQRPPTQGVNWRRVVWIAVFTYLLLNTGWCDRHRPLVCNPLILETCTP